MSCRTLSDREWVVLTYLTLAKTKIKNPALTTPSLRRPQGKVHKRHEKKSPQLRDQLFVAVVAVAEPSQWIPETWRKAKLVTDAAAASTLSHTGDCASSTIGIFPKIFPLNPTHLCSCHLRHQTIGQHHDVISSATLLALSPVPSRAAAASSHGTRSRICVGDRSTTALVSRGGRLGGARRESGAWILGGDVRGFAAIPLDAGVRRLGQIVSAGDMCIRCVKSGDNGERVGTGYVPAEKNDMSSSEKKFLTLPTILTLCRVAAIPALLAVFYSQETWATTAGATIFVVAAVTDWLDGYLARKMGTSSEFGAFLDPVADKLMVATTLVLLCARPPIAALAKVGPWLLPLPAIAIIGREITMSALREWAASQGGDVHKAVAVNSLGKWKTAAQMVALTLLLVGRDGGGGVALGATGVSLLYISAGLALWSLAVYIRSIWKRLAQ